MDVQKVVARKRKKEVANREMMAKAAFFNMEEIWTCVNAKGKGKHECKSWFYITRKGEMMG